MSKANKWLGLAETVIWGQKPLFKTQNSHPRFRKRTLNFFDPRGKFCRTLIYRKKLEFPWILTQPDRKIKAKNEGADKNQCFPDEHQTETTLKQRPKMICFVFKHYFSALALEKNLKISLLRLLNIFLRKSDPCEKDEQLKIQKSHRNRFNLKFIKHFWLTKWLQKMHSSKPNNVLVLQYQGQNFNRKLTFLSCSFTALKYSCFFATRIFNSICVLSRS